MAIPPRPIGQLVDSGIDAPQGMDVDGTRPPSPGGSGDPILFDEESENADE